MRKLTLPESENIDIAKLAEELYNDCKSYPVAIKVSDSAYPNEICTMKIENETGLVRLTRTIPTYEMTIKEIDSFAFYFYKSSISEIENFMSEISTYNAKQTEEVKIPDMYMQKMMKLCGELIRVRKSELNNQGQPSTEPPKPE